MWKVWLYAHPVRSIIALHVFLALLAFMIHFVLLSTDRYNWLGETGAGGTTIGQTLSDPVTGRIG